MKRWLFILTLLYSTSYGQDSTEVKRFTIQGYIKNLQSLTFNNKFSSLMAGNIIHNRLNLRWHATNHLTTGVELRNRIIWGDEVRIIPGYASQLRNANEYIDLSATWLQNESIVFHTNIDRMWMEYHTAKWNFRVGRQRINWGIGSTWNPNDLFNTFNFLDFDYEERPGRDAVKFQYQLGAMSHIEVAYAPAETKNASIAAARYFINKWNYDFQFTGGWFNEQITAGVGWSGSIKETGFKGEAQYYFSRDSVPDQFNLTMEADHMFASGWYLSGGLLINSTGAETPISNWNIGSLRLSPKNLMPTRWNAIFSVAKEITPLLSATTTIIYSPRTNLVMVLPSIQYNIASNVDVNIVWQSFFAEQEDYLAGINHLCYLRLKWSF